MGHTTHIAPYVQLLSAAGSMKPKDFTAYLRTSKKQYAQLSHQGRYTLFSTMLALYDPTIASYVPAQPYQIDKHDYERNLAKILLILMRNKEYVTDTFGARCYLSVQIVERPDGKIRRYAQSIMDRLRFYDLSLLHHEMLVATYFKLQNIETIYQHFHPTLPRHDIVHHDHYTPADRTTNSYLRSIRYCMEKIDVSHFEDSMHEFGCKGLFDADPPFSGQKRYNPTATSHFRQLPTLYAPVRDMIITQIIG